MKKYYFSTVCILYSVLSFSQSNQIDTSFNIGTGFATNDYVNNTEILNDSKIIVSGNFTSFNSTSITSDILVLNTNGTISYNINTDLTSYNKFIQQSDGKLLICGSGTKPIRRYSGFNFSTIDNTFNFNLLSTLPIFDAELQPDNKLLIMQKSSNTSVTKTLKRINSDGSDDNSFTDLTEITCFRLLSDGKILVIHQGLLKRLDSNGLIDYSFTSKTIANFYQIVKMEIFNNKLYFIGDTGSYGNGCAVMRYLLDGTGDSTFNSFNLTDENIKSIDFFVDGKILIGCTNSSTANSYNGLILLNSNGTVDSSFSTSFTSGFMTNNLGTVYSVKIQNDFKILVGGNFTSFNSNTKRGIVRLNGFQNLDIENFNKNEISIYPNPVKESITLSSTEYSQFEIFDLLGKIVLKGNSENQINVGSLTKGVYVLKLKNGENTINLKFIKE